jgi:ATP-binding cassette ChvD family protein
MQNVGKVYPGGREVLKDVTLQFLPGAKIGVLGLNGAGKSTLLRVMAGEEEPSSGEAWPAKGVKVGYLPQEPELNEELSVSENIGEALGEMKRVWDRFQEVSMALGEEVDGEKMELLLEEQADLQEKIDAADMWDMDRVIEVAMEALRCPPGDSRTENLSGGERRRVALCRLLLSKPDILLLDEPTNHLDALTVSWLQRYLSDYKGMVVLVTHDRYFLDNVTGWILELDRGSGIPYKGNYSSWLDQKHERLRQSGKLESERLRTLVKEKEWIGSSPSARRAKSKARIRAYDELVEEHESRKKQAGHVTIRIPLSQRLGDVVVESEGLRKVFGDKLLFEGVNFRLPPGGIVGVVGGNGAGKTTLMRMIMGQESPDGGKLRLGETVDLGYVDQSRDILDANSTVFEAISDGEERMVIEGREVQARAYVGAFNFKGSDQEKKVGQLSGGERNRVHLARILKRGCNLLLLDEPTNDLDVETLRSLEDALESFPGSVVVVSHDRWFLDRMASHILAFEGESEVVWFEGNYGEYEEDRRKRLGLEADQPKPIKYRPLTV